MKVANCTNAAHIGGVEVTAAHKSIELSKLGHQAYWLTLEDGYASKLVENTQVIFKVFSTKEEMSKFVKEENISVLAGHTCGGGSLATDIGKELGICCGETVHSIVPSDNLAGDFEISITSLSKQLRPKSTFIPLAFDTKRLTPALTKEQAREKWGIPQSAYVICRNGRLVGSKTPTVFVETLARLSKGVWGLVGGGGPEGDTMQRLGWQLGCGDRIRYTGIQYDVADIFVAADLICYATHDENLTAGCIEPAYQLKPIVCSIRGGMSDYCLPEETMLEANTPDEFVTQVMRIIKEPELGVKLADNMFKKCTENGYFLPEEEIKRYIELYESVLK